MKARLLVFLLVILTTGCFHYEEYPSQIEDGVVIQTIHRPYHTHESCHPVSYTDADGTTHWSTECTTDHYSEAFYVVLACQHGQFVIDNERVWKKVHPGMRVGIRYTRIERYKNGGKKGEPRIHVGTDYRFDDCWPTDREWNVNNVKVKR